MTARLRALRESGRLVADPSAVRANGRYTHEPNVTLLLADDASYGFIVAVNPSDRNRRIGPITVRLAHRSAALRSFILQGRSTAVVAVGSPPAVSNGVVGSPPRGTPPPFADPGGTSLANARLRVVFAPFAGARIAELSDGRGNAATSIGLLRDAVAPELPASPRDYIATYTHPLPAGTFNRPYSCNHTDVFTTLRVTCSYDAPDLPRGGAVFKRTLTLTGSGGELLVGEEFTPHETGSTARLESISGFAFGPEDASLVAADGNALGILHGHRLTSLRWRAGDVARRDLRWTRDAELVTLVFARRDVELRLSVAEVANGAEAQGLLNANQP